MTQPQPPQAPPMMDILAAMRCWAVEIRISIDGKAELFRIEAAPAAEWIIATFEPGHLSYLPGMLSEPYRGRLLEALAVGTLTPETLAQANQEALEQASGWKWWQASRLLSTLRQFWATLGGMLFSSGVHPRTDSLGAVLGATYSVLWQNAGGKEERDKLIRQLMMPPAVDMGPGEWDEEAAEEALWQMLAAAGATQ